MGIKGNLLLLILLGIIASVVLLPVIMYLYKPADIIIRIILVFLIINMVRGYLGNGVLTLIIAGVLIYFLVIKWWWVGASGAFAIMLVGFGFFSVIVWGIGTNLKKG